MNITSHLYILLMAVCFILPFLWSFERKLAFYKSFGPLFIGIFIVGTFFIIWDTLFTYYGVWGFTPKYLSGIYLGNLPLGEWLFFIVIPYCCVFLYRVVDYTNKRDILGKQANNISYFLMSFSATIAIVYYDRWYTVTSFGLLAIFIYLHQRVWQTRWMGRFYWAYIFILIPFFIVNGILTGTGLDKPVVWYNDQQNLGIRILTIPIEDIFYGMTLILGVITIYEKLGAHLKISYAQETVTE